MIRQNNKLLSLLKEFKELGIGEQIDYNKFYLYSLITHSTAIEGSTVTEIENQLLFDEGIPAKGRSMAEQLMNLDLKAAYEHSQKFASEKTDITIELLKSLSAIVMKNTGAIYNTPLGSFSSTDGDLRLLNVTAGAGGRSYMNYSKVPQRLQELCESINQRRKIINKSDIIECYRLSFDIHFHLLTIHPWVDGNGRMSRLVMNQVQFEMGVVPSIINKDRKAEYIEALVATREQGDIEIFRDYMFDEHTRNIEKVIEEYKKTISWDEIDFVPVNVPVNVPVKLSDRERDILNYIELDSSITAKKIAEILDVSEKTIKRSISLLKEQGVIERIGSDKSGKWAIIR